MNLIDVSTSESRDGEFPLASVAPSGVSVNEELYAEGEISSMDGFPES